MPKIDQKQQQIIRLMMDGSILSSSKIQQGVIKAGEDVSLITVKRILSQMVSRDLLVKIGSGRTTGYAISVKGRILAEINAKEYCSVEPDKRIKNLSSAIQKKELERLIIELSWGLSYIQPFEDGNKRTSRLLANAILLAYNYAPLSYRSVDENDYREAILVFYELNSIMPFKKIFISQYEFAAKNYAVKRV